MRSKLGNPWFGAVLLALLLAIVATSCQSGEGDPTGPGGGSEVSSSSPFPAVLVKPGGIVAWNTGTGVSHTVTSD